MMQSSIKVLVPALAAAISVAAVARITFSGESSVQSAASIAIQSNQAEIGEGENVVISAMARLSDAAFAGSRREQHCGYRWDAYLSSGDGAGLSSAFQHCG